MCAMEINPLEIVFFNCEGKNCTGVVLRKLAACNDWVVLKDTGEIVLPAERIEIVGRLYFHGKAAELLRRLNS